jgi:Ankyrin repeat
MFPHAVQHKDINGCYPLHLACKCDQSATNVLKLIDLFPEAANMKASGKITYPLHYARANDQSVAVVLKLIELFPDTLQHKDINGCYQLHIACKYR